MAQKKSKTKKPAACQFKRKVYITSGEKTKSAMLLVKIKRQVKKHETWTCEISIKLCDSFKVSVWGVDALSAMQNCFEGVTELFDIKAKSGVDIWWLQKGDCAGFRDLTTKLNNPTDKKGFLVP